MIRPSEDGTITIVSGAPRCGSSLVMRMLGAAGVPLYYDRKESWEHSRFLSLMGKRGRRDFLAELRGMAVKWLDPAMHGGPKVVTGDPPLRAILLTRNPLDQALSQLQFSRFCGMTGLPREPTPGFVRSIAEDNADLPRFWRDYTDRIITVRFEQLVRSPADVAARLAAFVGCQGTAIMAAQVRSRPTGCSAAPLELQWSRDPALWHG